MITFKNAEKCHKRMWDWLTKTGDVSKSSWPEFYQKNKHGKTIKPPLYNCFACEIVGGPNFFEKNDRPDCPRCPIDWKTNKNWETRTHCDSISRPHYSVYTKWKTAGSISKRKKYAAIIRDMPWVKK